MEEKKREKDDGINRGVNGRRRGTYLSIEQSVLSATLKVVNLPMAMKFSSTTCRKEEKGRRKEERKGEVKVG